MKKYWYWIELIGFDVNDIEASIDTFLRRTGGAEGVSLLLFSVDFVNAFEPGNDDEVLSPAVCSYAAHPSNGERLRQEWTKGDLKRLVAGLRDRGVRVLLSIFNMYLYHLDGREICEGFSDEHPEINERCCDGSLFQVVSMIKHLRDGRDYGEYFTQKLLDVLDYFAFDGVQIADGISSARLPVERADYSDDLVMQFVQSGGKLPEGVPERVGDAPEAIQARAKRIFREIRPQWTKFISERWSGFLKQLTKKLKERGKFTLVNTAWTREPSEAYIRYAMDYAASFDENVDALMVEENAQTMAEGGIMHYGGVKAGLARRARLAYDGYVMQLALKALFPSIPQITMCPVRDNQEQFDTLRCAYTEIAKSSALRNMAVCFDGQNYVPVSDNLLYTLSDAVTEHEWSDLHALEERFTQSDLRCERGVLALFSPSNPQKEAERYFACRALTSSEIYVRCILGGLPISGSSPVAALGSCKQPVIAANAELYSEDELAALENYSYPLFTAGYAPALKKQPDMTVYVNGNESFCICGYNLNVKKHTDCRIAYPPADLAKKEGDFGGFTAQLNYEQIPAKFFAKAAAQIVRILKLPYVKPGTGCRCFPTGTQEKEICVLTNDSYYYELPRIETGRDIASAAARCKTAGYRVGVQGSEFSVLVDNRGAEAVELTFRPNKEER